MSTRAELERSARDPRPYRRRLLSVTVVVATWVATMVTFPGLVVAALIVDGVRWAVTRRPFMAIRLIAFLAAYLTAEVAGLLALAWAWVASGFGSRADRLRRITFGIQRGWAAALLEIVEWIFDLRITVDGTACLRPAPYLIFGRHASIVDNLLANRWIAVPFETHIRYVMKDELRVDPCLDIAGSWLPNVFVRRGSGETDRETRAIADLGATAGPTEVVLIYPEGTRFSLAKLERITGRLQASGSPHAKLAATLRHVLPPKVAGPIALLEATDFDVVVMAHSGLDGFARVSDIWRGGMVGTEVHVDFRRIPRREIPADRAGRERWIHRLWVGIDVWVEGNRASPVRGRSGG